MNLETITLTPITVRDRTGEFGEPVEDAGHPLRIRARVREISGSEVLESQVQVEGRDTEFDIALLPSTAGITKNWRLEARGTDQWEIIRALRAAEPGATMETRLIIRARLER